MSDLMENCKRGEGTPLKEDEQFAADLKIVMGSVSGRRLLWKVLEVERVLRSSFLSEGSHPEMVMAYDEGRKELGRRFYAQAQQLAPKSLELMLRENKES